MPTTRESLAQANGRLAAGQLGEAERLYREVVQAEPDNGEAWIGLGSACHLAGKIDQAVASLAEAARLRPHSVEVHHRLGVLLAQNGQLDRGVAELELALQLQPGAGEIAKNLRIALATRDHRQGIELRAANRLDEAAACHLRAVQQAPDHVDAWTSLAQILVERKRFEDAARCFQRIVELKPDMPEGLHNLGLAYMHLKRYDEALAVCRRSVEMNPKNAEAQNSLGVALALQNRWKEAEPWYRQALTLEPAYADAMYNLGRALTGQDKFDQSIPWFQRAVAVEHDHLDAHYSLALTRMEQNHLDEAITWYERTIALSPDHVDAHLGLAIALFLQGRYAEAWGEYEWRLKTNPVAGLSEENRWKGEPLEGRTIFLRAEQGVGDSLQFIRYAPLVKQRGGRVVAWCLPGAARLLATCRGVDAVCVDGEPWPQFDLHAPLMSLPGIFGTTSETIPADVPYLIPDQQLVDQWKAELGVDGGFKVGIAWKGSDSHPRDRYRSIPLRQFAPLASVPGVRLFSLQSGAGREQLAEANDNRPSGQVPIVDLGDRLGDFYNTAAIIRALDLVITCDSAPAHVAGAAGANVWVALPFAPDWRWMLGRADTPWYPTMRLFRQVHHGDWTLPFEAIRQELARLANA